jgi:soluble epoxide hydrolase / lipid-phosphate phosphatase
MNVAYGPPTPDQPFNLDAVLQFTTAKFGYGTYWYWKLFTAPDGPEIIDKHLSSFWDVAHGEPESWLETLCKPDGAKNFLLENRHQSTMPYASEARKERWIKDYSQPPGFDAPLNYYRAMTTNLQDEAVQPIPKENYVIKVPFLFWGGEKDYVCRPELMQMSIDAGLIKDHTIKTVDSGHWAHLDKPKEFGETLIGWLKEKF